ncbi:hypothetical protein Avbf_01119 [Armadillidium vulgare]|nr:hypothetical protein Avbf_01119 [Armadillidium vulgare]
MKMPVEEYINYLPSAAIWGIFVFFNESREPIYCTLAMVNRIPGHFCYCTLQPHKERGGLKVLLTERFGVLFSYLLLQFLDEYKI